MQNREWYNKNRFRLSKGMPESGYNNFEEIKETIMSKRFLDLMLNRMILGTYRYGNWRSNKTKYDRVASVEDRLLLFKATGNKEHLIDIANLCMIEFEISDHPNAHFEPIDDGVHVKSV